MFHAPRLERIARSLQAELCFRARRDDGGKITVAIRIGTFDHQDGQRGVFTRSRNGEAPFRRGVDRKIVQRLAQIPANEASAPAKGFKVSVRQIQPDQQNLASDGRERIGD